MQEVPLESTPFPSLHSVHTSLLAEHFTQSTTAHATTNKYNINPHIQCPHIFFLLPLLIIQKVLFSITISTSANNVTIYWHPSFFNPQCGQFCVTMRHTELTTLWIDHIVNYGTYIHTCIHGGSISPLWQGSLCTLAEALCRQGAEFVDFCFWRFLFSARSVDNFSSLVFISF